MRFLIFLFTFCITLQANAKLIPDDILNLIEERGEDCLCGIAPCDKDYKESLTILEQRIKKSFLDSSYLKFPDSVTLVNDNNERKYDLEGKLLWQRDPHERLEFHWYPRWHRLVRWTDSIDQETGNRNWENTISEEFVFFKDYTVFSRAFQAMKEDLERKHTHELNFCNRRIEDINNGKALYSEYGTFFCARETIGNFEFQINRLNSSLLYHKNLIDEAELKVLELSKRGLNYCAKNHNNIRANYELGSIHFLEGDHFAAFDNIKKCLDRSLDKEQLQKLASQTYALRGEVEAELHLFADAVISLTEAIKNDPTNYQLYLQRATAYFENGEIELALSDYLQKREELDFSPSKIQFLEEFSVAFALGAPKGFGHSLVNLPSTLLGTVSGVGNFLWAGITEPELMPGTIASCLYEVLEYLHKETIEKIGTDIGTFISPELTQLVTQWDTLSNTQRGNLAGLGIGEFGVDVLFGKAILKSVALIKKFRQLKQINTLYSLEVLSQKTAASEVLLQKTEQFLVQHREAAKKFREHEKIINSYKNQPLSEENIRQTLHKLGYKTFKRPIGIPSDFRVKFTDKGAGMKYIDPKNSAYEIRVMPGKSHSQNPCQQKPYVKHEIGKDICLDKNGNPVPSNSIEAHIPLDEYIFRGDK